MSRSLIFSLLVFVFACTQSNSNLTREENLKLKQYIVKGKSLFQLHCSNCHGPAGEGLVRMYPPLANSDWVVENPEKISCSIRNGISGKLLVNGIEFSGEMPPHEDLTNLEIAEITAFLLFDLNDGDEFYDVNEIIRQLETCED